MISSLRFIQRYLSVDHDHAVWGQRAVDHIDVRFQNVLQSVLDRAQCEQRNARGFEFQQKIHVAVWAVRAIGIGTEQFCFLDRVFLRGKPHAVFEREGSDIYCEVPVTYWEAALGGEIDIPTLEGKEKYTIPEGTQSGTTFRLKGKGIPGLNGRGRGDQYVTVYIETPRNLNREQKEALKKFSESLGEKNYEEHKSFFGKFKL